MLPAIILAFILSVPILAVIYHYMTTTAGYTATPIPTGSAVLLSLALGLLIPAVSAIIPIRIALSKNLNDSLNLQRSKMQGDLVKIFDRNKTMVMPFVVFGGICVFSGTAIYYFLPKGFLLEDYALLLNMFFLILSGLIIGLTLLTNNLQGIVELIFSFVFFFWERKTIKIVLAKNLAAHKSRNKLTSIIYALTLGCVIFILVAVAL